MASRNFNQLVILRILAVIIIPLIIGFLAARQLSVNLIIGLSALELVLAFEFIRFINKSNRQINFFIKAIKNDDTTLRFPVKTGNRIINDLHQSLNELNDVLQKTRVKGQIKERYFSEILQHIGTGVIVCNDQGFVSEVNPAALELFGMQTLTHLSQLERIDPRFKSDLLKLSSLQKQVITLRKPNEQVQIITRCSIIKLKEEDVKLITLQDIRGELERKELDSWVKLIRVLSHEIMNSLAPVTSIAQSLKEIWKKKITHEEWLASDEAVDNTIRGLEVIGVQGEGLIRFVQSYRVLTKVPVPHLTSVSMHSLADRLSILLSPMKTDFGVAIEFHYPKSDFQVQMDEQMIIQIVINLVKNATEALVNTPEPLITITCKPIINGEAMISVADNGPGIPEEILEEIFVPFFTTKTNGTGIGLSHSRQIIRAHGGTINCTSKPGKTVFKMQW
jgi:two-component system, NtrC family, nitrogen regulation sensor histidine kinase NtrY